MVRAGLLTLALTGLALSGGAVFAQGERKPLRIEITEGVIEPLPTAIPAFVPENPGAAQLAQDITRVVVADLTNSTTEEQIAADMRDWRDEIQKKPELWRTGWSADGLRVTLQRWFDRHAEQAFNLTHRRADGEHNHTVTDLYDCIAARHDHLVT